MSRDGQHDQHGWHQERDHPRRGAAGGGTTTAKSSVTPGRDQGERRGGALRLVPVARLEVAGPVHTSLRQVSGAA